jgi:hypothetical protein
MKWSKHEDYYSSNFSFYQICNWYHIEYRFQETDNRMKFLFTFEQDRLIQMDVNACKIAWLEMELQIDAHRGEDDFDDFCDLISLLKANYEDNKYVTRPVIITLCGPAKNKKIFDHKTKELTLMGMIVLSICPTKLPFSAEQINILNKIHLQKIDISDAIFVINYRGHIGGSTKREIQYAQEHGKQIYYLEEKLEATNEPF